MQPSQLRKSMPVFGSSFCRSRERVVKPCLLINFYFDASQRRIEEAEKTVGEIRTRRFFTKDRRQISAQTDTRKFNFDAVDLRSGFSVALKLKLQPEKASSTTSYQTIPFTECSFHPQFDLYPTHHHPDSGSDRSVSIASAVYVVNDNLLCRLECLRAKQRDAIDSDTTRYRARC